MFDFTTENILNDLSRVSTIDSTVDPGLAPGDKALFIKRLNKFKASTNPKIYKSAGYAAVNEVGNLAAPATVVAGEVYRLEMAINLSGSQAADYSRWAVFKGKPIYAEYLVTTAAAVSQDAFGAAFALSVNNILKKQGVSDVVVTYDATGNQFVITATNEYQRFIQSYLEKLDQTNFDGDYDVVSTGTIATAGKEGFGTSWFLTKNIRLPTIENLRFMGENQDEKPVEGAIYNQYTIRYTTQRNIGGQGVVGERDTSVTTHVLYVINTQATTFEGYLTTVFGASALIDGTTNAPVTPNNIADIQIAQGTVSAATAVANTIVGNLTAYKTDLSAATGVTYTLVTGTGSTDNALFKIVGNTVRTVGAVTAGAKSIRVSATDGVSTFAEPVVITVSA